MHSASLFPQQTQSEKKPKEKKYSGQDLLQKLRHSYSGEGRRSLGPYLENKRFEEPEFKGSTPLMIAASYAEGAGSSGFAMALVFDKSERAFEAVEDPNRPKFNGMNVACLAACANAFDFFNQVGITLQMPNVLGSAGLIRFLNTANPHGPDQGSTPLMYFAGNHSSLELQQQIRRMLIDGADATVRLSDSREEVAKFSALDFALRAKNYAEARLILVHLKNKKNFDFNQFIFESFKLAIKLNNFRAFKFLMVNTEENATLKNQVLNLLKQENQNHNLDKYIIFCERESSQMEVDSNSKKHKLDSKEEPKKKKKIEACRLHSGSSSSSASALSSSDKSSKPAVSVARLGGS